jgi:hypothetical protein
MTYEISRIQPYIDNLDLQISYYEEFTRRHFTPQYGYKLIERIRSKIDAKYGNEVVAIFDLGRNIFPIAYMVRNYYLNDNYRKNIDKGDFEFPALLPNLGDPIKNIGFLPNDLVKEWNAIVRDIESRRNNGTIVSKFEKWVEKITRHFDSYST